MSFQAGELTRENARELNELKRTVEALKKLTAPAPLSVRWPMGIPVISLLPASETEAAADKRRYPLDTPCPVPNGYGGTAGNAQRWVMPDGTVKCEVTGFCDGDGCGSGAVPPPPVSPPPVPPVPPVTPPDPHPDTYSVFVQITECPGKTPTGFPYTVTCPASVEGTAIVSNPPGGVWFTGIPWGTITGVGIATSDSCWWSVGTVGCGGTYSSSVGAYAPVPGSECDHIAVTFSVGTCGPLAPPTELEDIAVAEPVETED